MTDVAETEQTSTEPAVSGEGSELEYGERGSAGGSRPAAGPDIMTVLMQDRRRREEEIAEDRARREREMERRVCEMKEQMEAMCKMMEPILEKRW